MSKLPISIIIPCCSDARLKECLASIDVNCDVVVALNCPTAAVKSIVKQSTARSVTINRKSLPAAHNAGIKNALYDKVILIDSDCTFKKGAIESVYQKLQLNKVVKGYVSFLKSNLQSTIVSNYREYTNYYPPKPWNPFLCFDKKIKERIGGYYFDESISWTEDAELHTRLIRANINFYFAKDAVAYHDLLNFVQDLRSAFNYGTGKAMRVVNGIARGPNTNFKDFFTVCKRYGILTGIYSIFWNSSYLAGYLYYVYIVNRGHRWQKLKI